MKLHFPAHSLSPYALEAFFLRTSQGWFFFFPCWPQGTLAAEFDGAALATEGKMVPANGILVSQMHKTEDSTLAGGFDVVHVHKDFVSLLRVCGVQICDGTHSSFSSLCIPVGTHAKI